MDTFELIELESQKLMIESLISNDDLFSICSNILQPDYFEPEYRSSIQFILKYYNDYNALPPVALINAETGKQFTIHNITNDQFDFYCDKVELFCRERAVFNEVSKYPEWAEQGDYGQLLQRMESAVQVSIHRDLGINIFENVEDRIAQRKQQTKKYSTGWPQVDEQLDSGISKTELLLFSANSGGGKSVALSNLALSFASQGLNVLYISLELSELLISDRFETMITEWTKQYKLDHPEATAEKIAQITKNYKASVYVKYMPGDETCSNDIKAYLKQFQMHHGFLPDVLIVDYLDILETNEKRHYTNDYQKDKRSSTQLRAIGNNPKHPMIMATASQQTRGAIDQLDPGQNHIAGGLSKVNICDVYISIIMTNQMRMQGMAYFKFLKTRSSSGVGVKVPMIWDAKSIRFKPSDEPIMTEPTHTNLKNNLNSDFDKHSSDDEEDFLQTLLLSD